MPHARLRIDFALTVDDAIAMLAAMTEGPGRSIFASAAGWRGWADAERRQARRAVTGPTIVLRRHQLCCRLRGALARFVDLGARIVEIDIEPFYEAARLLYEGPWVAERYLTARALIAQRRNPCTPSPDKLSSQARMAVRPMPFRPFTDSRAAVPPRSNLPNHRCAFAADRTDDIYC